ncbi:MAG: LacI family DNA-binding transcriptional regulator [Gemmatimonadaceae bacterium]|nr:LacI family DNA-binding transcriptional regulator [Gemmatimonadaceae bacterium]
MAVTIRDVARASGFSVATVSRVLNGSGPVKPETVRKVRDAATRLRFTPNVAARSLSTSRTHTLGVLLPDLHGEFFSEVIRGIDQTAQSHGYHVLVSSSHNSPAEIAAALATMRGRVDGVAIMSPVSNAEALVADLPRSIPLVLLNCSADVAGVDTLDIDNHGGAYAMTRHLLTLGRRRIAFVRGPKGNADGEARLGGYRAALEDAGVVHDRTLELDGDFQELSGYHAAKHLLSMSPRPDALFAANDSMAIGAISALREAGVRVPEDVAVVGFDDIPIARYILPALSTVRVDIAKLGARAVKVLLHAVGHRNEHTRVRETFATELVVRASCGVEQAVGR